MEQLVLYTDGGCHGNPGPGAWAFRLIDEQGTVCMERCGGEALTTNNRMELSAVIEGLRAVKSRPSSTGVQVITDSQYVRQGISSWIKNWKRNGWRTANKTPVKNVDLWQCLDAVAADCDVSWSWVRGHSGNEHNEACDRLVQAEIARLH